MTKSQVGSAAVVGVHMVQWGGRVSAWCAGWGGEGMAYCGVAPGGVGSTNVACGTLGPLDI